MSTSKLFGKDILITSTTNATGTSVGSISTLGGININRTALISGALTSTANSNTIGNIFTTGGNIGIGTTAPVQVLDVNGNLNITGNFYQNGSVYSGSTQWGSTGANIYFNTGNVGIGTLSPTAPLHVQSNLTSANTLISILGNGAGTIDNRFQLVTQRGRDESGTNSMVAKIGLIWNTSGNSFINFYRGGNSFGGFITLSTNNDTERMIITSSGNVGIGTTSPTSTLDVNCSGTNSVTLRVMPGINSSGSLIFGRQDNVLRENKIISSNSNVSTDSYLRFDVNNGTTSSETSCLMLRGDGNIGIGTTTPNYKLDVNGSVFLGVMPLLNIPGSLRLGRQDSPSIRYHDLEYNTSTTQASSYMSIKLHDGITTTSQKEVIYFRADGNVGIGTSAPAYTTDINGTFEASNSNGVMLFASSGNVGIGTTNPGAILDIPVSANRDILLGSLRFATNFGNVNYIQSSSSRGNNGTWSPLWFTNWNTTSTPYLVIGANGNIGINTTSPTSPLDTINTSNGQFPVISRFLAPNTPTVSSPRVVVGIDATDSVSMAYNRTSTTSPNNWFGIGHNNVADGQIVLNRDGNVGIGTLTPATTLHINKNNYAGIQMGNNDASGWTFAKETNGLLAFYTGAFGSGTFRFGSTSTGNFGIGIASPAYKLHVSGDIYATGDVTVFSDQRLKTNIQTINNALDKVNKLRGVSYKHIETDKNSIGLIAQETMEILPEVVATKGEYLGINYGNIVGLLIEAVKELTSENIQLKEDLNNIKIHLGL